MQRANARQAQGRGETAPEPLMELLDCPKRVRVLFGGQVLADSTAALLLRERGHVPVYYFPRADVRMEHLVRTTHSTH
jgi:uncharacterized protein (DUF427 family)